MKKLLILAIIGWMSMLAGHAQIVAFHGGYQFQLNHGAHPNRVSCAVDYYENHGVFGVGMEFPSNYDERFGVNLHGGLGFYWDNFLLSPQVEVAYNTGGSASVENVTKPMSGISVGASLLANYKIVGPLGAFMKIGWLSPVVFDPLSFGSGGTTTFSLGLTMFWFR